MIRKSLYSFFLLALLALVACTATATLSSDKSTPVVSKIIIKTVAVQKDATATTSPLQSPLPVPVGCPAPSAKRSALTGNLVVLNPRFAPASDGGVYLVPTESDSKTKLKVFEVDPENSVQATVDAASGDFALCDVPPGEYFLLVVAQIGTIPMLDTASGMPMVLTLQAGELFEMGEIQFP